MIRRLPPALLTVMLCATIGSAAMPPALIGDGEIREELTANVALTFWQDGWQDMILQPVFSQDPAGHPVSLVGWVIPVPNEPSVAEFASDSLLEQAWRWIADISIRPEPGDDVTPPQAAPAGGFTPEPIDASYELVVFGSADKLGTWCDEHGLARLPDLLLDAYGGDTHFVAVSALLPPGADTESISALRPVRVSFRTDRVVMPLRLSGRNGPFHAILFAVTSLPLNLRDLDAFGFTSMDGAAARRQDHVLELAGASDSSRAILWYDVAGSLYDARRLSALPTVDGGRQQAVEIEGRWLNERLRGWRSAPMNRLTAFSREDTAGTRLDAALSVASRQNAGDAPAPVVDEYILMAREAGLPLHDSLYVTAVAAPMTNLGGSPTELSRWWGDPAIRLRDLTSIQPQIDPPAPGVAASDTADWTPPEPDLLPMPDALGDLFAQYLAATTWESAAGIVQQIMLQDITAPRVSFYRQLVASGRLDALGARMTGADSLLLPDETLPPNHPRSPASFERSLRPIRQALAVTWVAAQYTPERPNPLFVVARVRIEEDGTLRFVRTLGDTPSGLSTEVLRTALERDVTMPPADRAGEFDIVFSVAGE